MTFFSSSFHFLDFRNDGMEDRYSILIRLDSQDSTDSFYKHFSGRRFSSLEVGSLFLHILEYINMLH